MKEENNILNFFASKSGKNVIVVVCILLIYGLLFVALESNSTTILGITLLACAYFGWITLNRITPQVFLFMSIGGWAVFLLIKGLLSIVVGAFVAPFQIGKIVSGYVYEYTNKR